MLPLHQQPATSKGSKKVRCNQTHGVIKLFSSLGASFFLHTLNKLSTTYFYTLNNWILLYTNILEQPQQNVQISQLSDQHFCSLSFIQFKKQIYLQMLK
jgi:hypothetical protein